MSELTKEGKKYIGYDYKEADIEETDVSMYLDGYINFGWTAAEDGPILKKGRTVVLRLKRDRAILNKMELTRLERHFESCMNEIKVLKKAHTSVPTIVSLGAGLVGTGFMACSTFAVTASPPIIWLCILMAIPGFAGWISPYYIYRLLAEKQKRRLAPLLETKYDEIYEVCKKGNGLL